MEDGPFSTPEFLRFANDVVLLVINAASPEADAWPKAARGANAAPCSGVCILDVDGNVLARPGRTVEEFVADHQLCVQLTKLRRMQAPRPPAAEKSLFLVELRLGLVDPDQLESRAALLDLNETERATVRKACTTRDVYGMLQRVHEAGPEQTAAKSAALAKAGCEPDDSLLEPFWAQALMHAAATRDRALARRAFDRLSELQKGNATAERTLTPFRRLLDAASR